jgi:hypothetical protein
MQTNREKLRDLIDLLDEAPLDVSWLRAQLDATETLPETEVGHVVRATLARLHHVQWALSLAAPESAPEAIAHQRAIEWLASARQALVDHGLN